MSSDAAAGALNTLLERIRQEIIPVIEQAIADDEVCFRNPHLPRCWEAKACDKGSCPAYHQVKERCWQKAGTYCGGKVQGDFVAKHGSCVRCEVFAAACPTVVEELGEHLNNMLFLLRKQKARAMEGVRRVEYLNRELTKSLESLDAKNREIQEMVITDRLTGLYNRHYLFTVLEDEVARTARGRYAFSVLLADVDDFKSFNDTYGHLEGDKVLAGLGGLLRQRLRKTDRAFRYGGEEFVVVLPDTDTTIAYLIAERIRLAFADLQHIVPAAGGSTRREVRTLSIGVAGYEPPLDGPTLLARADEAMYRAKSQGKNQVRRFGSPQDV
ncbi:MAG: GGDEF domain-containing protein [Thermodesulfobacteriota bacterium]